MSPLVSLDRLEIPKDHDTVHAAFKIEKLMGVRLEDKEGDPETKILTRKACEEAGVPFEFFQRFASLSFRSSPNPLFRRDTASDFLSDFFGTSPPPLGEQTSTQIIERLRHAIDESFERTLPSLKTDGKFDLDEAEVLDKALYFLDHVYPDTPILPGNYGGWDPTVVQQRVRAMVKNECWLSLEGLRAGLFGTQTRLTYHRLFEDIQRNQHVQFSTRSITSPCSYLPEFHDLTPGLFYRQDQVPERFKEIAQRTVRIETPNGWGSGTIWDNEYVVTNRHFLGKLVGENDPGHFKFQRADVMLHVRKGDQTYPIKGMFEVLPIRDDLVVLYIPNELPSFSPITSVENLPYDEVPIVAIVGGQHRLLSMRRRYHAQKIFVAGYPIGNDKPELLFSAGRLNSDWEDWNPKTGLLRTSVVTLPGNSGGPAVDNDGRFVGIMTSADLQLPRGGLEESWYLGKEVPILGTRIYTTDLFTRDIRKALEEHRNFRKYGESYLRELCEKAVRDFDASVQRDEERFKKQLEEIRQKEKK